MDTRYRLMVKFKASAIDRVSKGRLFFKDPQKIVAEANFVFNQDYQHVIPDLAENGELRSSENSIDFSQYKGLVYVRQSETMTRDELERLAVAFSALDIVEYTELEPLEPPPPPTVLGDVDEDEPSILVQTITPDFSAEQDYLRRVSPKDAAVAGIDADYAWSIGANGQGVRVADIEWGFIYDHENLAGPNFIDLLSTTNHEHDDHGAAVAGIILARHSGRGMRGANPLIDAFYGISELARGRFNGIRKGLEVLRPGDVFIYEMQTTGRENNYVPPDFDRSVWDITKQATDAGIIVVCTAGNGHENLDHPYYDEYRGRGDNGIIMVGAGSRVGRNHLSFSCHGSPVHVQGWGDWSVATTGYGPLFNEGRTRTYTHLFSGTSSAAPIAAAAVIAIQSWYKANRGGAVLAPRAMRDLLIRTGLPQGSGAHIGPLPNIRNAIEELQRTGGARIVVIDTAYHMQWLADDPNALNQILVQNDAADIRARNGVWVERIVFPNAAQIQNGRWVDFSTVATWSTTLVVNGVNQVFATGGSARFVVQNGTWIRQ